MCHGPTTSDCILRFVRVPPCLQISALLSVCHVSLTSESAAVPVRRRPAPPGARVSTAPLGTRDSGRAEAGARRRKIDHDGSDAV